MTDVGITTLSLTIALVAVEGLKKGVDYFVRKNGMKNGFAPMVSCPAFDESRMKQLQDLHDLCLRQDNEGRYLIYNSREEQREQTLLLRKILEELRKR